MEHFKGVLLARLLLSIRDGCFECLAGKASDRLVLVIDEIPLIAVKLNDSVHRSS